MTEHKRETAFLKSLMAHEDSEDCRQLQDRLAKAERETKCIKRAVWLVGLLAMFCAAGLGYSAVLLDDFFRNKTHPLTQFFAGLGTTAVIALVFFLGNYFWHRTQNRRLHEECRLRILSVVRSRLGPPTTILLPTVMREVDAKVVEIHPHLPVPQSEVVHLSKAS